MTTFDERERTEEAKFKHDLELNFRIRNRRNRLFGQWVAQTYLGLSGEAADVYAKDVVMADFEQPGHKDMLDKVRADLRQAGKDVSEHMLERHVKQCEEEARRQVMAE